MFISQKGIDLIKFFEGCRLLAYKCPAGIWTIGYGHTGKEVCNGLKITLEKAEKILKSDLKIHCNNIIKLVKVSLNQNQFDALVSFEYNIGNGAFASSTLLKLLNKGNYKECANQFLRWKFANGKALPGLEKRRKAERELFLS